MSSFCFSSFEDVNPLNLMVRLASNWRQMAGLLPVYTVHQGHYCLVEENIENREVNSLFDYKESYRRSIILLQERGDIQV